LAARVFKATQPSDLFATSITETHHNFPQVDVTQAGQRFVINTRPDRIWNQLFQGPCATVEASPYGNYLYCETSNVPYHKVVRVRVSNGNVETVMEIKGLRRAVDVEVGTLFSVARDGSVLLTRDVGTEEVYALGVNWP
jgi:hypothetical protein